MNRIKTPSDITHIGIHMPDLMGPPEAHCFANETQALNWASKDKKRSFWAVQVQQESGPLKAELRAVAAAVPFAEE